MKIWTDAATGAPLVRPDEETIRRACRPTRAGRSIITDAMVEAALRAFGYPEPNGRARNLRKALEAALAVRP